MVDRLSQAIIFNIQKFSIHDGPGIRTTVFFKGCPLRCRWCSNPESQEPDIRPDLEPSLGGKGYTLAEVVDICLEDQAFYEESGGGVTLSGGEVLAQGNFARNLLIELGERNIHRAIETAAFAAPENFWAVAEHCDLILFDIKHHHRERHLEGTGCYNDPILKNLGEALARNRAGRGPRTLPRIPVIPGYNDRAEDAAAFAELLRSAGAEEIQLLPFHQFGQNKYALLNLDYALAGEKALHPEDLESYRAVFDAHRIKAFF